MACGRRGATPHGAKAAGVWQEMSKPPYYKRFSWELSAEQLQGTRVGEVTQTIWRQAASGTQLVRHGVHGEAGVSAGMK